MDAGYFFTPYVNLTDVTDDTVTAGNEIHYIGPNDLNDLNPLVLDAEKIRARINAKRTELELLVPGRLVSWLQYHYYEKHKERNGEERDENE